jgi:signal transduction histidine kinase
VDLNELVAAIVADASFEAHSAQREVKMTATAEINVIGRLEQLHRAIENVIRNALKYTHADSTVEVTLRRLEKGEAQITVADRGPGVADADLAAMFEPFRRLGNTDTPGFGLGLAIARRVIEAHGGHIVAHNRDGGGLMMDITLPSA